MTSVSQEPSPQSSKSHVLRNGLVFLALILVAYLATRAATGTLTFGSAKLHGFPLTEPVPIPDFRLTTSTGDPFSLYDLRGKVVLLYFGYTFCPDVCPTTLADLTKARNSIKEKYRDDIQVVMVTVDPARDTPEVITEYLSYFDDSFIGLVGSENEIAVAASPIGIFYERRDVEGASGYLMDHTASVAVLDKRGRLRTLFPFNSEVVDIAHDLTILAREK